MKSLLTYWKPSTADHEVGRGSTLDHSASEQFRRVEVGDHVWIVTVRKGVLFLLGRIIVGRITDQAGASHLMHTHDLWKASHHIIAVPGSAEPTHDLKISSLAKSLRFDSKHDRLSLKGGVVNAQQLQTMRILQPASAVKLELALRRARSPSG